MGGDLFDLDLGYAISDVHVVYVAFISRHFCANLVFTPFSVVFYWSAKTMKGISNLISKSTLVLAVCVIVVLSIFALNTIIRCTASTI